MDPATKPPSSSAQKRNLARDVGFNLWRWADALSLHPRVRLRIKSVIFRRLYGFDPPPRWSDLTGYEDLLEALVREGTLELDGDVVEIGAFLGGGTYKLSKLIERRSPDKRVFAIDVFDASLDATTGLLGLEMSELYRRALEGRDQRAAYEEVVADCSNVRTIQGDSAAVEIPTDRLAFGFIDGNHDPEYVRGDFETLWGRLVPGGVIGFDDYGSDLPQVTRAIHRILGDYADEISRTWTAGDKVFLIQRSKAGQ